MTTEAASRNRREFLLLVVLVVLYFAWLAQPAIWSASDNKRLVSVFSSDETDYLKVVQRAIQQGTLRIEWQQQGHLYANLVLLPLFLANYHSPVSEQTIIVSLRLTCIVFGAATVLATFVLARRYFGRFAGWFSALLMGITVSELVRMSLRAHSDTLNMFLMVVSVYFCCRLAEDGRLRDLVLTSAFGGLSFSSKFAGVLLLPVIGAVAIARTATPQEGRSNRIVTDRFTAFARYIVGATGLLGFVIAIAITPEWIGQFAMVGYGRSYGGQWVQLWPIIQPAVMLLGCGFVLLAVMNLLRPAKVVIAYLVNVLGKLILVVVTFSAAAFVCSPLAFDDLLKGFFFEGARTAYGGILGEEKNALLWFNDFIGPTLIDKTTFGLLVISLATTVYNVTKRRIRHSSPELIMWAWIAIYVGFLIVQVGGHTPRYLLPIIPFVVILAAHAADQTLKYLLAKRAQLPLFIPVVIVAVSLFFGLELLISLGRTYRYRQTLIHRVETSPAVKAGNWLAEHYAPSSRVLYDTYAYVPPQFTEATKGSGTSLENLQKIDPDIVIVNQSVADIYADLNAAKKYASGERAFRNAWEYYQALTAGRAGYTLVQDFGEVQVYAKR